MANIDIRHFSDMLTSIREPDPSIILPEPKLTFRCKQPDCHTWLTRWEVYDINWKNIKSFRWHFQEFSPIGLTSERNDNGYHVVNSITATDGSTDQRIYSTKNITDITYSHDVNFKVGDNVWQVDKNVTGVIKATPLQHYELKGEPIKLTLCECIIDINGEEFLTTLDSILLIKNDKNERKIEIQRKSIEIKRGKTITGNKMEIRRPGRAIKTRH